MKFKEYFTRVDKKVAGFLILLVLVTGLIRSYNFNEFLLVRLDQVRDAEISKRVLDNGVGELRLLGPRITSVTLPEEKGKGGDNFYMGPYYYYVQALSMKIFNNPAPWVIAVPDFILSLLAIPVFYLIISRFFSKKISILATIIFSSSFLILQYSRFSWNPNQLIFWQLILIYSLVMFSETGKKSGKWFLLGFLALIIVSQLHFLAAVATALIFILFFIYQKSWKKLKIKHYLWALGILVIFYLPVIVSELENDWGNTRRMWYGFFQQSSNDGLVENLSQTFEKTAQFYFYFPFSINKDEIEKIELIQGFYLVFSLILIGAIFSNKFKIFENIKSQKKKTLIVIILLYFGIFFLINIGLANRLEKPRYWMSVAPVSFFILAFWLEAISLINKKKLALFLLIGLTGLAIFQNLYSTYYFYNALEKGDKEKMSLKDPIFRPHRNLIVFGQLERAVDYMNKKAQEEKKGICYLAKDIQTKNTFKYIAEYKYPDTLIKTIDDAEESAEDCVMFYINRRSSSLKGFQKDIEGRFEYEKIYRDKAIVLWRLKVKEGHDLPSRGAEIFENKEEKDNKVYLWREVFEK